MTKKLLVIATVLLVHTAAAHAQQSGATPDGGNPAAEAFPPAYAPPPGYKPAPPAAAPQQQPYYGPGPTYGGSPGGAPAYGAPPAYGQAPGHYPPPHDYYRYPPPPPRRVTDRPFTLGGGIGFGGVGWRDSLGNHADRGMAYTLRLGFGLRPGVILMWDLEGAWVDRNGNGMSQTANLAALQIFATNRLFLKGGIGFAAVVHTYNTGESNTSDWGGAAMGGIGYELIQGWNWSLDIEATVTGARYNTPGGGSEGWSNWSLVNFAINFF
jgi:hypothetical protein